MSYKSENWKEKLEEVRNYVEPRKEGSVEKCAEDIVSEEIDLLIAHLEEDLSVGALQKLHEEKTKLQEELKLVEAKILALAEGTEEIIGDTEDKLPEVPVIEEKLSIEKTVEKLTEKNMLGRLAKSLRLDEQGKEQMFDYFEKGELKQ